MELAGRDNVYFGAQPNAISSLESTVGIQATKILELETRIKALESIIFEGKSFGHFAHNGFPASPARHPHPHPVETRYPARLRAANHTSPPATTAPPPPPPGGGPSALRLPNNGTTRSLPITRTNPNPNAWSASSSSDQELSFTSVRGRQEQQRVPTQEDGALLNYYDLFASNPPGPIEPPQKRLGNQRRVMLPHDPPPPPLHEDPNTRNRLTPQARGQPYLAGANNGHDVPPLHHGGLPPTALSQDIRMGTGPVHHRSAQLVESQLRVPPLQHPKPTNHLLLPHHPQTKKPNEVSSYVTTRDWKENTENEHQRSMTPEPTQLYDSSRENSITKPQDPATQIPPRLYRSLDLRASVCKLLWIPVTELSKAEKIPQELKEIYLIEDWNSLTDEQVEYTVSTQLKFLRKMRPIIYAERLGEMTEILRMNGYTEAPTGVAKMSEINKYLKDCGYKPQRTKKKVFKPNLENGISPVEIWRDYGHPLSDQVNPATIDDGLPAAPYSNPKKGKKTIREKVAAQKTKLAQVFECENEADLVHINQLPADVRSYYRGSKPASHRVVQKVFTAQSKLIKHYQDVLTVLNQKDDLKRLLKVDKLDPNSPQIPPKLRALYLDRTRVYLMHPETRRELKDRQQKFITEYRNQVITPIKRSLTRVLRARGYPPALDDHAVLNTSQIRYYFRSINFDKWKQIREDSLTDICDELEDFLSKKPDSNVMENPAHGAMGKTSQPSSPRHHHQRQDRFIEQNEEKEPGYETDDLRVGSPILAPRIQPQESQLASPMQVGSMVRPTEEDDLRVSEVETSLAAGRGAFGLRMAQKLHDTTPTKRPEGHVETDNKTTRGIEWSSSRLQGV